MKKPILLISAIFICVCATAQTYFSAIPDFGGDNHEGKIFNIIPLEDQIKVIGALHDSIVPGLEGGTWQLIASISYNGELLIPIVISITKGELHSRMILYATFTTDGI